MIFTTQEKPCAILAKNSNIYYWITLAYKSQLHAQMSFTGQESGFKLAVMYGAFLLNNYGCIRLNDQGFSVAGSEFLFRDLWFSSRITKKTHCIPHGALFIHEWF